MNAYPGDTLRVRVYNVGFGDAVLISVPDRGPDDQVTLRHILIDVGNALGKGGGDAVFKPVLEDVAKVLAGQPLDLYVMTHEHMDHVQGLLYAWEKWQMKFAARYAWLTASAEGQAYYDQHPDARQKLLETQQLYALVDAHLNATPDAIPFALQVLMMNNNPRATADCVDHLRQLAGMDTTFYVHRESDLTGTHPFHEAKLEILAPEEDTSAYYHTARPTALYMSDLETAIKEGSAKKLPLPPQGVDVGEFYNLVHARAGSLVDGLLGIDKAANNTSIVFSLEWRGWRLLFPGDAEERSWELMKQCAALKPVHFLKVSHHGSANGTPDDDAVLDAILPPNPPDNRPRTAVISTAEDCYSGVPDREWIDEKLGDRCTLHWTDDLELGEYVEITFDGAAAGAVPAAPPLAIVSPAGTRVQPALTADELRAKVLKFAPVARFGKNEYFFPTRTDDYVSACSLHVMKGKKKHQIVVPPNFLTIDDLSAFKGKRCFLVYADERFRDSAEVARLTEEYRQRQQAMGLLGINIRDLLKSAYNKVLEHGTLAVRTLVGLATGGPLPQEVFVKALALYGGLDRHPPAYHYHFAPKEQTGGKYDVLQYWFFYSFNDWCHSHKGVNDHEADWEAMFLYFRDIRSGPPEVLVYSAHSEREKITWNAAAKEGDTHPVVYVSPGSHASFPTPKIHLALGELEWEPGDVSIGYGGTHKWHDPVSLTAQPWVDDFSGQWGGHVLVPSLLGTVDKPGGSPCGPRWQGVRKERDKWKDPVTWAGLD